MLCELNTCPTGSVTLRPSEVTRGPVVTPQGAGPHTCQLHHCLPESPEVKRKPQGRKSWLWPKKFKELWMCVIWRQRSLWKRLPWKALWSVRSRIRAPALPTDSGSHLGSRDPSGSLSLPICKMLDGLTTNCYWHLARDPTLQMRSLLENMRGYLWLKGHLMWRAHSLDKTLMLGKIKGRRRRGWQRMRWLDSITDSVDLNLSKIRETGKSGLL